MANRYGNLIGTNKISDEYPKINQAFDTVQQEVDALDERIEITEADIEALDEKLDTIILNPIEGEVAAQEVVLARGSADTLPKRLDGIDSQLAQITNENDNSIMKHLANPITDPLGFKSINIIGDSISHGANAPYIYNDAWSAIFRKAMQTAFDTDNHGFVNLYPAMSNEMGTYTDQLYVTSTWTRVNTTDTPGFSKYTSSTLDQNIKAWIQDKTYKVNKVGIGVLKSPVGGDIRVLVRNSLGEGITPIVFNLYSATEAQEIMWVDVSTLSEPSYIEILNKTGTNTVWGCYLIDDLNKPVVNNYSRSGARIGDLGDSLIDRLFNTNVVIFALGHNSTTGSIDPYLEKCRLAYETYKPMVYVVDLTWTEGRFETAEKLKQFAKDCNGQYIEIIPRVADSAELITNGFLSDTSHPTVAGHKIIAEKVLNRVKAPITSKDLSRMYREYTLNESPETLTILKGVLSSSATNDPIKNSKIRVETVYSEGTPTGNLYLKSVSGMWYIYDITSGSSISAPIQMVNGEQSIGNGYKAGVTTSSKIYIKDKTILENCDDETTYFPIVNGVVTSFTEPKTLSEHIKDLYDLYDLNYV